MQLAWLSVQCRTFVGVMSGARNGKAETVAVTAWSGNKAKANVRTNPAML